MLEFSGYQHVSNGGPKEKLESSYNPLGNVGQGSISSTFYEHLLRSDPKSAKRTDDLTVFFAPSGSARIKAASRTLMKLTPSVNFINVKCTRFSYKCHFSSYMYVVKAAKTYIHTKNSYVKMLMKLTP